MEFNVVWTLNVLQVLNDMAVSKLYYYLYNTIEGAITIPIVFTHSDFHLVLYICYEYFLQTIR